MDRKPDNPPATTTNDSRVVRVCAEQERIVENYNIAAAGGFDVFGEISANKLSIVLINFVMPYLKRYQTSIRTQNNSRTKMVPFTMPSSVEV